MQGRKLPFPLTQNHVVEADLGGLTPDSRAYSRIKWCLERPIALPRRFLCCMVEEDGTLRDVTHQGAPLPRTAVSESTYTVTAPVPVVSCRDVQYGPQLREWLAMAACGADLSDHESDDFFSTWQYDGPRATSDKGPATAIRWQGLLAPQRILPLLQPLRASVNAGLVPWAAMTVWGFRDAPVTWDLELHGRLIGGGVSYTFVCFPGDDYWLIQSLGTYDTYS
eukprot:Colp12_sorted_trinity150504_noHs@20618